MTSPSLVTPNNTKDSIFRYQKELKGMDYCKIFDSRSKDAQIVNLVSWEEPRPLSWLSDDFLDFCHEQELTTPETFTLNQLTRTLPSVLGKRFVPNGERIIKQKGTRDKYLNTYKTFKYEHEALPLDDTFHAFFKVFIKNEAERHILFQYIAHMVQKPEERPSWHIMMPSDAGTGKGFLNNDILTPLILNAYLVRKFADLMGKFAPMLETGVLVWLDDCKVKSYDTQTELKSILSEERQLTEAKFGASKMINCYSRMILASNEAIPLFLDEQERRWAVFERLTYCDGMSPIEGKQHRIENYIRPLSNWLKRAGAMEAVHKFFSGYSLEGFDCKSVPYTESFLSLVENSKRIEQIMIEDWLDTFSGVCEWFTFAEAQKVFENSSTPCPSPQLLRNILDDCGYRQKRFQNSNKHMGTLWFSKTQSEENIISLYKTASF